MINKRFYLICLATLLFGIISCATRSNNPEISKTMAEEEKVDNEKTVEEPSDKEELKKSKINIATLIIKLNNIIDAKDFKAWKKYLSPSYIAYYSDPVTLKEQSSTPLLVKNKIVLRTLEDYFNYIVVGSRKNIRLDEIKSINRNRINAYMIINGTPWIIYELIKIDNVWKIGKFFE